MPVRRLLAHDRVADNRDRAAIQRGPLVYCAEGVDHGGRVRHLTLPLEARLVNVPRPELLGGVELLTGRAVAFSEGGENDQVKFIAIPYYAWANRGKSEMAVWLPARR
jgi:hypothetical protein